MIPPNNNGQGQFAPYDPQQQFYQFSPGSSSASSFPLNSLSIGQQNLPSSTSRPSVSPERPYIYAQQPPHLVNMTYPQPPSQSSAVGHSQLTNRISTSPTQLRINIPGTTMNSRPPSSSKLTDGYLSDADVDGALEIEAEPQIRMDGGDFPPLPNRRGTYGSLSGSTDSMVDGSLDNVEVKEQPNKRKPRITLPRGRACVACRKCTGDIPCRTCQKAGLECRYEELPRKKPRAVILEERVAELEACLNLRPNDPVPPKFQHSNSSSSQQHLVHYPPPPPLQATHSASFESRSQSSSSIASPSSAMPNMGNDASNFSLVSHIDVTNPMPGLNTSRTDIPPNSALELALIQFVLPFTPFVGLPVHSARFLALLTLPSHDPRRPHPALLYILFAQAVRLIELNRPPPRMPPLPQGMFAQSFTPPPTPPNMDKNLILAQVGGTSLLLLERARMELDRGIRNVDRSFDLTRAAIGIAFMLYSMGHFIEGWNIPVSRLLISCGLHRITGTYIPPEGGSGIDPDLIPKPYAPAHQYAHSHSYNHPSNPFSNKTQPELDFPIIRMRPIIIPPARDEIELAERIATFWAAKMQDWEAGIGWGWSTSLADDLCTTEWGWGWGPVETKSLAGNTEKYNIGDLFDPSSTIHSSPTPDTTYILATKSVALLHRANSLFDLPESSYPITLPDGRVAPANIAPLSAVQSVQIALQNFRRRIPDIFKDFTQNPVQPTEVPYDGLSDPWFIMLHSNLYAAEMLCWRELANYHPNTYETAVRSARAQVNLVRRIPNNTWANLDLLIALNLSLTSRFLFKESSRLLNSPQPSPEANHMASMASSEAEVLRQALNGIFNRFNPIAGMHSLIVQRVREGWPEKEGEYERI
ncbi:uncharacterized protein L201_001150 [Kwoniella dendrophila CBS 6074]|uniref:Zn(2)-C6 fungal-type domain-containing protein n=1 Tax=Kwoniella dendrophila CBS 6074 TaxID=1295534 RepID=A0AAX4JN80_9TREE